MPTEPEKQNASASFLMELMDWLRTWSNIWPLKIRAELWPRLTTMFRKRKMMAEHSARQFPLVLLEPLGETVAAARLAAVA